MQRAIDRGLVGVEILDEGAHAAIVFELALLPRALVLHLDLQAGVQKREFAQAFREYVEVKFDVVEGLGRWMKADFRTLRGSIAHHGQWRFGHTVMVELLIDLAVAPDPQRQRGRQGVHDRGAYAVQTA